MDFATVKNSIKSHPWVWGLGSLGFVLLILWLGRSKTQTVAVAVPSSPSSTGGGGGTAPTIGGSTVQGVDPYSAANLLMKAQEANTALLTRGLTDMASTNQKAFDSLMSANERGQTRITDMLAQNSIASAKGLEAMVQANLSGQERLAQAITQGQDRALAGQERIANTLAQSLKGSASQDTVANLLAQQSVSMGAGFEAMNRGLQAALTSITQALYRVGQPGSSERMPSAPGVGGSPAATGGSVLPPGAEGPAIPAGTPVGAIPENIALAPRGGVSVLLDSWSGFQKAAGSGGSFMPSNPGFVSSGPGQLYAPSPVFRDGAVAVGVQVSEINGQQVGTVNVFGPGSSGYHNTQGVSALDYAVSQGAVVGTVQAPNAYKGPAPDERGE